MDFVNNRTLYSTIKHNKSEKKTSKLNGITDSYLYRGSYQLLERIFLQANGAHQSIDATRYCILGLRMNRG